MEGTFLNATGRADDRVIVAEIGIVVLDCGPEPEWHRDRKLYGPWWRDQAQLTGYPALRELGMTPYEATRRLAANHRGLLGRRWSG